MTRSFAILAVIWLFVLPGCRNSMPATDGGVDAGSFDGGGSDAGCKGDLAGTELQICGIPDAAFDSKTCRCQGDL